MPCASLSPSTATTATRRRKSNASDSACTVAVMPCGLCAASSRIVGAERTASSRPGERTAANAARTSSTSSGPVAAPDAEERLDRGERDDRVLRLVRAVQRQEHLVVRAAETLDRQHLPADRDPAVGDAELLALARDRRLDLDRPAQQRLERLGRLRGEDRRGARLDDPGLLGGDLR